MSRRTAVLCVVVLIGACDATGVGGAANGAVDRRVLRIASERAIALADARYAPTLDEAGPVLAQPGGIVAHFSPRGATLAHDVVLRVASVGRGTSTAVAASAPTIAGCEVQRAIGRATEWWRALPSGLEHGVTLNERPEGEGALRIEVELEGATARARSADSVTIADAASTRFTYSDLVAIDAASSVVPAHMEVEADGARIVLVVDDIAAHYPLVIDPLVVAQEAALQAGTPVAGGAFGSTVSTTADATRLFAAGRTPTMFTRTGTSWSIETTLMNTTTANRSSVAISPDGTHAAVGENASTLVFVRSGTTWNLEATVPHTTGNTPSVYAFDQNATRLAFLIPGSPNAHVEVLLRAGATWSSEATLPSAPGASMALSRDGAVLAVGDDSANSNVGVVTLYVRTGSSWSSSSTVLPVTPLPPPSFGAAVAFSGDGLHLAVGSPESTSATGGVGGRVTVFTRASTAATAWGMPLVGTVPGLPAGALLGTSVAASFDGTRVVAGAPSDTGPSGGTTGTSRVFVASYGATPTIAYDSELVATPPPTGNAREGASVAIADDGTRVFMGAPSARAGGGAGLVDAGKVFVFTVLEPNHGACTLDSDCVSGFCVAGLCCNARCGGGCEQCDGTGTCVPSAGGTICRAIAGACDPVAEMCNGVGRTCPADTLSGSTTTCRAAAGACDVAEMCTGTSAACPADVLVTSGTMCAMPRGACDVPVLCNGTSAACPAVGSAGVMTSGSVCRASMGPCDPPEVCDGASFVCPGNVILASGMSCSASGASCAVGGTCDGTTPACHGGTPAPMGHVCGSAMPGNPCDIDDVCDGTSLTCPTLFAAATTSCGPASMGVCDAPDHCAGTSASCVPTFATGVVCRAAAGACDVAESCAGTSVSCPPDMVLASGVVCRASTATCDAAESCDGTSTMCPPDVSTCPPMRDAGSDSGVDATMTVDGSMHADASSTPAPSASCGCRAGTPRSGLAWLALLALVATTRRRRRAPTPVRGCRRRACPTPRARSHRSDA